MARARVTADMVGQRPRGDQQLGCADLVVLRSNHTLVPMSAAGRLRSDVVGTSPSPIHGHLGHLLLGAASHTVMPPTACGVIDSERCLTPARALPLCHRLASAEMRSDHLLCTDPRMVRGVCFDDHPARDDLPVRLPQSHLLVIPGARRSDAQRPRRSRPPRSPPLAAPPP
jgi:hypothetical protein